MTYEQSTEAYDKAVDDLIQAINDSEEYHGGLLPRDFFQKVAAVHAARHVRDKARRADAVTIDYQQGFVSAAGTTDT